MQKKSNCKCEPVVRSPCHIEPVNIKLQTMIPDTVIAKGQAVVVCGEKNASAVGIEIMKNGGNAFDAAIGVMAMLSLTRCGNCGIGGGGFATLYQASTKKVYCINGRERAPRSARSNMFTDSNGIQLPFNVAISNGVSVGVPGTVAMMEKITEFGKIRDWKSLFKPTIDLATTGYTVDIEFNNRILANKWKLQNYTYSNNLFLGGTGTVPAIGSKFFNTDLANTYKELACKGPKWFYEQELAHEIAYAVQNFPTLASINASFSNPMEPYTFNNPTPSLGSNYSINGALMTVDDLQAYTAPLIDPVTITYHGYKICSMPPPSSGGIVVAQTLKLLENYDLSKMNIADVYALFINANAISWADRNVYLGDAEFVNVPIIGLLSDQYINQRRGLLNPNGYVGPVSAGDPFLYRPISVSSGIDLPSCKFEVSQLKK